MFVCGCACVSQYVDVLGGVCLHAHTHPCTHTHARTNVDICLSMAGNLSVFLSISGARAQWDINYNMQQHHLCKSQWRGGITFLIKFPWLIVIKVSSVNVSSWLSNSGPETVSTSLVIGGLDRVGDGGWVEERRKVCGGHTETQIAPGHTGSLRTTDSYEIQLSVDLLKNSSAASPASKDVHRDRGRGREGEWEREGGLHKRREGLGE